MRQIVLDTETTGLELSEGHRIIEIGCVELLHRRPTGRDFHRYLRPDREVDPDALAVHGITGEFLAAQPSFAEIAGDLGLGAKVEVRRNLDNTPPILRGAALYGFYDIGAAFKNDAPDRESAATAGVGFTTLTGRVSSSIELAQPLTHPDVEGRKDLTLFAELALAF